MNDTELVAALAEEVQKAIGAQRDAHAKAIGVLEDRIVGLDEQLRAIPAGRDGKDGRPVVVTRSAEAPANPSEGDLWIVP